MAGPRKTSGFATVDEGVLERIAGAPEIFCFLDYDGTLAPLASSASEAVPPEGTDALLRELARAPGTRIALVTGRTIADLRCLLDVPGVIYVGVHGAETLLPGDAIRYADGVASVRPVVRAIGEELRAAAGCRPGIAIEEKGAAVACHYRLASEADAARAREAIAHLVESHRRRGAPLRLRYGRRVAEVGPAGVDKGRAVVSLWRGFAASSLPVYAGDDSTDEDAFGALPASAITIRVGPRHFYTRARYRLDAPDDVHGFLRALLDIRIGRSRLPRRGTK